MTSLSPDSQLSDTALIPTKCSCMPFGFGYGGIYAYN
jgi:hypothetical protein